ncbi:hypothetical protein THAOC_23670, partial [Thalassiosira oceanica]
MSVHESSPAPSWILDQGEDKRRTKHHQPQLLAAASTPPQVPFLNQRTPCPAAPGQTTESKSTFSSEADFSSEIDRDILSSFCQRRAGNYPNNPGRPTLFVDVNHMDHQQRQGPASFAAQRRRSSIRLKIPLLDLRELLQACDDVSVLEEEGYGDDDGDDDDGDGDASSIHSEEDLLHPRPAESH